MGINRVNLGDHFLSQVRDLFFDEFYDELERVVAGVSRRDEDVMAPPLLSDEARRRWRPYLSDSDVRDEVLVSVDGGVQVSNFAYGDFVAVGRACALVHRPGEEDAIEKRVKIYVEEVYDERDRSFISSYVRMISEYEAVLAAAEGVLEAGGRPLVLLDGSLYFSRFPYAIREYQHHPDLLAELFSCIAALHALSKEHNFPVVAVSKDSTVFYLYMELLKEAAIHMGMERLIRQIGKAVSPLDLRLKMSNWSEEDKEMLKPLIEGRTLCDTALIRESVREEGYTLPLLLAPSIYYGREDAPALYSRIRRTIDPHLAEQVVTALKSFFDRPGIAVTYWKPTPDARPFRVDISASTLGYDEAWEKMRSNGFVDMSCDLSGLERVLNHLGFWFCNEVEYNIPLHRADMLARFDRHLYQNKYEPFIISRLRQAGIDVEGRRRTLREVGA